MWQPSNIIALAGIAATALVALVGHLLQARSGKQVLEAKDAAIAALEREVKAKEAEKVAEVKALQAQVQAKDEKIALLEQFTPMSFLEHLKGLKELNEAQAEELKRLDGRMAERELEFETQIAQAKADGAQAVARAKEEALRQVKAERGELVRKVGQLQGVAAASGTVAGFIEAQPSYSETVMKWVNSLGGKWTREDFCRIIRELESDEQLKQSPEVARGIEAFKKFAEELRQGELRAIGAIKTR